MGPSTPPRTHSLRDVPATPATPRFGSFEDLPDAVRKQLRTRTPHRRKRSAGDVAELATPRQTPNKRKVPVTPRAQLLFHRDLAGVDEDAESEPDAEPAAQAQDGGHGLELELESADNETTDNGSADNGSADNESEETEDEAPQLSTAKHTATTADQRIEEPYAEWGHPHQARPPPNVPGMWYVFRGKKVFRPLPPGAPRVEPVTLFKDEIEQRRRVAESEEDTDVETLW